MASRFSAQMPGQIAGWPEAMRVMSRKPPAARRSSAACSSARWSARLISAAAARWGTWLTTATRTSWRSGGSATTSAPRLDTTDATAANTASVVAAVGVSTQTAPSNSVGVGAVESVLLGARHRVPAEEAGVVDGCDDRRLHAADVGDEAGGGGEGFLDGIGHGQDRAWRRT